jgi:hypothetical protein
METRAARRSSAGPPTSPCRTCRPAARALRVHVAARHLLRRAADPPLTTASLAALGTRTLSARSARTSVSRPIPASPASSRRRGRAHDPDRRRPSARRHPHHALRDGDAAASPASRRTRRAPDDRPRRRTRTSGCTPRSSAAGAVAVGDPVAAVLSVSRVAITVHGRHAHGNRQPDRASPTPIPIEPGASARTTSRRSRAAPDDPGSCLRPVVRQHGRLQVEDRYIDGDKGILRYRGYPIEQLAEKSSYLETAYLIVKGELPTASRFAMWHTTSRPTRSSTRT